MRQELFMQQELLRTERNEIKRKKERASYNRVAVFAALDEAFIGTIAFHDGVNTHAIPTAIWRNKDYLYIHGSNGSRLINFLQTGAEVCVSVTNLHGVVMARSALRHSMNYSSVCIYGAFENVIDEKEQHMKNFLEHVAPGRWQYVRKPDKNELDATTIMKVLIQEAVLKSRSGPPVDFEADLHREVWAGVMPLQLQWQVPRQVIEQDNPNLPGKKLRQLFQDQLT